MWSRSFEDNRKSTSADSGILGECQENRKGSNVGIVGANVDVDVSEHYVGERPVHREIAWDGSSKAHALIQSPVSGIQTKD